MIERAFIHVGGCRQAGKSTLVEAVLLRSHELVLVARCVEAPGHRRHESSPPRDHELKRYLAAGATDVARFSFRPGSGAFEDFFDSELMSNFSDAVILEGDDPLGACDLEVFVARAPQRGQSLFVRRADDAAAADRRQVGRWVSLLQQPDGMARWVEETLGLPIDAVLSRSPAQMEKMRANMLVNLEQVQAKATSAPRTKWAVREGFRGIEHAGLVIVNVHPAEERRRAEAMVTELVRLRQDPDLFDDILGQRGRRTPITVVAADLLNPSDPGRKKALARIGRTLRSRMSL
ncbi:MAG: hypothetical protein ACYCYK_02720 [Candidatus Dormibacteria bacterium]